MKNLFFHWNQVNINHVSLATLFYTNTNQKHRRAFNYPTLNYEENNKRKKKLLKRNHVKNFWEWPTVILTIFMIHCCKKHRNKLTMVIPAEHLQTYWPRFKHLQQLVHARPIFFDFIS